MSLIVGLLIAVQVSAGCAPNQRIINSAQPTPSPPNVSPAPKASFEQDVEAMRTADFSYIYVFRRRDGAEMDPEDKSFINSLKPAEVNRVKVSDDGRAVIFGSNFRVHPDVIGQLAKRFEFEDLSPEPDGHKPPVEATPVTGK